MPIITPLRVAIFVTSFLIGLIWYAAEVFYARYITKETKLDVVTISLICAGCILVAFYARLIEVRFGDKVINFTGNSMCLLSTVFESYSYTLAKLMLGASLGFLLTSVRINVDRIAPNNFFHLTKFYSIPCVVGGAFYVYLIEHILSYIMLKFIFVFLPIMIAFQIYLPNVGLRSQIKMYGTITFMILVQYLIYITDYNIPDKYEIFNLKNQMSLTVSSLLLISFQLIEYIVYETLVNRQRLSYAMVLKPALSLLMVFFTGLMHLNVVSQIDWRILIVLVANCFFHYEFFNVAFDTILELLEEARGADFENILINISSCYFVIYFTIFTPYLNITSIIKIFCHYLLFLSTYLFVLATLIFLRILIRMKRWINRNIRRHIMQLRRLNNLFRQG